MPKRHVRRVLDLASWARRRHSVMVLSGPASGVRHFTLPGTIVIVVAALCVLGILGGSAALLGWSSARVQLSGLDELRLENVRLQGQIEDIRESVAIFESRMEESVAMEKQFRTLANLQAIPEDVRRLGVGGPQPFSELADEASPSELVREARDTLTRLDELNRKAHFQHSNFQEMFETLKQSREELDRTPSVSPVRNGWVSSRFGMRKDPFTGRQAFHPGMDISAWTGTPVHATANGKVKKAGRSGTLGLMVELDHGNGITTRYGHNSRLLVKVGQKVKRGDVISEVGSTGRSTSPHLHYEVRVENRRVNPWRYILDGGPVARRGA